MICLFSFFYLTVLGLDCRQGIAWNGVDKKVDTKIEEDLPRDENHSG